MKKRILPVMAVLAMLIPAAIAAPPTNPTNFFPAYKGVIGSTSVGDTGLGVGTNYICFALQDLSDITTTQVTNDLRIVIHTILNKAYSSIQALNATNRPSLFTISEVRGRGTGDLWKVQHDVLFNKTIGTWTYPSE